MLEKNSLSNLLKYWLTDWLTGGQIDQQTDWWMNKTYFKYFTGFPLLSNLVLILHTPKTGRPLAMTGSGI